MRMRGVTYDTGFLSEGTSSHTKFERRECTGRWKLYVETSIALLYA
ncbi:hypothetical protein J2S17_000445 [Cytobacillus purgationiresistens]|uniref:Uncharacterized protein n=1 Tax=Cytobacillus purgationiresistens TaxID=863449 RepID=A0ABU0ABE7_9BACI|nr:hypothetical protein [Cytobacillus purgationiresistens]